MSHSRIVTENQLDEWVRGNAREAQGMIVELVWRLVAASAPKPRERRFPLGDSIGQPGPDGVLFTDFGFDPFVPEGRSFWEIGMGIHARDKATSDYRNLTAATPHAVRRESTFIFVTPLSARRDWPYTWKKNSQAKWLQQRRRRNDWQDVCVIDGSGLIDWLLSFPAVERWLADVMGLPAQQIQTAEERWTELKSIGAPPPLTPQVFLVNRDAACEKLKDLFSRTTVQLKLDTHFPDQVADFVAAYVASMDENARVDAVGRSLIISGVDGWNAITSLREAHVLVADFHIDEADSAGTKLLERARRGGHAVIFGGMPGGIPHPNRVSIPSPKSYQIKDALEKAGYNEERARILAQKSDGNLSSLLRCLQNLSVMPEWAQGTDASELAIAELLGAWRDNSEADKAVSEKLSKKAYGEWIGKMREIALRPGTPLILRNGVWKVISRYEGWYALGPRIFDEHLDRLKEAAVNVLRERDPQFELSPDERYAANIHGKVLTHSHTLRNGLMESLALLGSHPKALTSCSFGKAETTAILSVREILANADWVLWGSLNDLSPLLAEAAPGEFLDAVENALNSDPCPFDTLFAQEGTGIMGRNYMTGLLWALETLAWDTEYLTRVVVILGELAARDPGGNWANRPANSLSTILLPWFPQTCASVAKRKAAVETLISELPDVAWKLLLNLLPESHQITSGSHKPAWREMIADDWSEGTTNKDYFEQIAIYANLTTSVAKSDFSKLVELIDRLDDLPPPAHEQILAHLGSEAIASMPQSDRFRLWTELVDLVTKHRKFADANWAMPQEQVDRIAALTERIAPASPDFRHRMLFSERDFDLYEEKGNYEEQRKELEERRQRAIDEVFATGGLELVLEFAKAVDSPWRVGFAFGVIADNDVDRDVLPEFIETENKSLAQFAGGYVWGRFRTNGWQWVDEIDTSQWQAAQIGQFLAYLPFTSDTWERSAQFLGVNDSSYWTKASANPYEVDKDLELAVDRLIEHDRPHAAIRCLGKMRHDKQLLNSKQAIRALLAALDSSEGPQAMNVYDIVEVIKALQDDPDTNPADLFRVEWAYLRVLDRDRGAHPKLLEQRLADSPEFFCEIIRTIFRSTKEDQEVKEPTELQKNIATNAYRLLHQWKTPPGTDKEGAFNGGALNSWLEHIKTACAESGHLEIALTMAGHVLIHTPPDPDGLWIDHSAASALNAKDANDMRDGFTTEFFNSRGVHKFTAGREERQLAERYRKQADEVEARGYHRLANSLKKLASSYEHDAEREAARDPFED
jgi:DNA-binding transcriptional ArsR family regulator